MSELLLPPSANWFQHNGVSCRETDRLLVTACFKSIMVYNIPEEKGPPKCLKLIPYSLGKLTGVSLFPNHMHEELGHAVAVIGDHHSLSLITIHDGSILANHKVPKGSFCSLSWGHVRGEDVVVAVGDKGSIILWQPQYDVIQPFVLDVKKNLSVVLVLPHIQNQALIASDKTVLLVSLLNGDVLNQYKGHENPIYTISWYTGEVNPKTVGALPVNTRWKTDEEDTRESSSSDQNSQEGPFFATSDLGRNVLVWDLSAKRFLAKSCAPVSAGGARRGGRDRGQGKSQHIAVCWVGDRLFTSTVMGETIQWNLSLAEPKYKLVNHAHSRAIYNMVAMGNILITFSQDRNMQGFDIDSGMPFFCIPTLGGCACTMAFSPHDASRLAIGMQDESIKLLSLGNECQKTQSFYHSIAGKVLAICWHPAQEGKILFGTSEGQVGIADVCSNKISTFAYYHQKSVYKVEWGLAIAPAKTGLNENWYAYSFGDRELVARSTLMNDPVQLNDFIGISKDPSNGFCLSEFTFSPEYRFLAIGSVNGEVKIIERETCDCLIVICRARKVIQHLLWKPPSQTDYSHVLGVASGENSVYIFDLTQQINERSEGSTCQTLTQPLRELCAHSGRVIWLSWSPHKDGFLATSSYDHTVQIWDTNSGEPLGNYGGHSHRVFRAEFFPTDADRVVSFGEENCIHSWQISRLTSRTPAESSATLKDLKKKNRVALIEDEQTGTSQADSGREMNAKSNAAETGSTLAVLPSKRSIQKKSSFPLFHGVSSKKKSFHHLCIFSLLDAKEDEERRIKEKEERDESLFEEDLEEEQKEKPCSDHDSDYLLEEETLEQQVAKSLAKYRKFYPSDQELPTVEDVCFYLNFFGPVPQMDKVVKEEIKNHDKNENFARSNLMRCWQGSLESHIRWAAKHKQLDPFLISTAPQVSFSLWEYACEAYADQISAEDPVTAATYLVSVHKDEEAVDLLLKSKNFREALTIAKYRMGFNSSVIQKVLSAWFSSCIFEGNFETASFLQLCLGNTLNAARTLARRNESRSLTVAANLYLVAGNNDLAYSTAGLAFVEASSKNEYEKFEPILQHIPTLFWCKVIHICHNTILEFLDSVKDRSVDLTADGGVKASLTYTPLGGESALQTVLSRWNEEGINKSNFLTYSKEIKQNLTAQKLPTSLKHLWFLVSVALSEMLLDGLGSNEDNWEKCLEVVLNHVLFWGKEDQIYNLTHILLRNGFNDFSTLRVPVKAENPPYVVKQLQQNYILSETKFIVSMLENDDKYVPWAEDSSDMTTLEETSVRFCDNAELNGKNLDKTDECEGFEISTVCEHEVHRGNGTPKENVETALEDTVTSEDQLLEAKTKSVQENHCQRLYICRFKEDFLKVFEMLIAESVRNFKEGMSSYSECMKTESRIISKLYERSALGQQKYTKMLANISSVNVGE